MSNPVGFASLDDEGSVDVNKLEKRALADPEIRKAGDDRFVWRCPASGAEEPFSILDGTRNPSDALLAKWAVWAWELGLRIQREDGTVVPLRPYLAATRQAQPKVERTPVAYSPRARFAVGDRLEHARFGPGKVIQVSARTILVKFELASKKLAHGLS